MRSSPFQATHTFLTDVSINPAAIVELSRKGFFKKVEAYMTIVFMLPLAAVKNNGHISFYKDATYFKLDYIVWHRGRHCVFYDPIVFY